MSAAFSGNDDIDIQYHVNWTGAYRFTLLVESHGISDLSSCQNKMACFHTQENQYFHGIITHISRRIQDSADFVFKLVLSSPLLRLDKVAKKQYFAAITISDVIRILLHDAGFDKTQYAFQIAAREFRRGFLIQHQESDWAFFRRLIAEEGWYVIIEQSKELYRVVITDTLSADSNILQCELASHPDIEKHRDSQTKSIRLIRHHRKIRVAEFQVKCFSDLYPSRHLWAKMLDENKGIGRLDWIGSCFENEQQVQQKAKILKQATNANAETVVIELAWHPVKLGDKIKLNADAMRYPNLDNLYQVIAIYYRWQGPDDPNTRVHLVLVPNNIIYRNPILKKPKLQLISATIQSQSRRESECQAGRYLVAFDHYQLRTSQYPAVRALYPMSGHAAGFHFILSTGSRVRIGFLYGDCDMPVILGAWSFSNGLVTGKNKASYQLKSISGLTWTISENKQEKENQLSFGDGVTGFSLKNGAMSGIKLWSKGMKKINAQGDIKIKTQKNHLAQQANLYYQVLSAHDIDSNRLFLTKTSKAICIANTQSIEANQMQLMAEQITIQAEKIQYNIDGGARFWNIEKAQFACNQKLSLSGKESIHFQIGNSMLILNQEGLILRSPRIVLDAALLSTGMVSYG